MVLHRYHLFVDGCAYPLRQDSRGSRFAKRVFVRKVAQSHHFPGGWINLRAVKRELWAG
jgi:hypothetical protein